MLLLIAIEETGVTPAVTNNPVMYTLLPDVPITVPAATGTGVAIKFELVLHAARKKAVAVFSICPDPIQPVMYNVLPLGTV